jgi:hypothetical protein
LIFSFAAQAASVWFHRSFATRGIAVDGVRFMTVTEDRMIAIYMLSFIPMLVAAWFLFEAFEQGDR